MFIIRITIILVIIAAFVLVAAYLVTRNKKYLTYTRQLVSYSGWLALVLLLFYLISRVIRI
jgi:hypothetical protein